MVKVRLRWSLYLTALVIGLVAQSSIVVADHVGVPELAFDNPSSITANDIGVFTWDEDRKAFVTGTDVNGQPSVFGCTTQISDVTIDGDTATGNLTYKEITYPNGLDAESECVNHSFFGNVVIGNAAEGGDGMGNAIEDDDGDGEPEDAPPSCETTAGQLGWIICPVMSLFLGASEAMSNIMNYLLLVSPLDNSDESPVYAVWLAMRNIALALLVIGALGLIIMQAIRPDVDAYLVKRIIPRLGGAAIGIMLSFFIMSFVIDAFNVFGQGIQSLLFGAVSDLNIELDVGGAIAGALSTALFGGGILLIITHPATWASVGLILLPVVVAFLAALVTLLARHVLIITLVITSPIAFAFWVLPNTDKWFKRWWSLFMTMMFMYPIIMLVLAAGNIVALALIGG